MVTFDNEEIKKGIARIKKLSTAAIAVLVITMCIEAAVFYFTSNMEKYLAISIALIVVQGVALISVIILLALKIHFEKGVKQAVLNRLAAAMAERADLLSGDSEIALVASYSGDKLTLSRQNSFKEVTFDLSGIKPLRKVYSNFGTYIAEYLQGYYAKGCGQGYESVTVTDGIAKNSYVIEIVKGGKPCKKTENNYFLKRGLIK
ncbi:MAG: hypothetical protein ACI4QN_03355 [Candidatus Coproplasma sp.]